MYTGIYYSQKMFTKTENVIKSILLIDETRIGNELNFVYVFRWIAVQHLNIDIKVASVNADLKLRRNRR